MGLHTFVSDKLQSFTKANHMKAITLTSVILAGPVSFTIMFIVMRVLFKKSLLFKIGMATGAAIVIVAFISGVIAKLGPIHNLWGFPLQVLLAGSAYVYITRVIKKPLMNIISSIDMVSEGDLTTQVDEKLLLRRDEIGQLANSTQRLTEKMSEVVEMISSSANQVSAAGEQLNASSQALSSGANQQASSVEEVSSSMEEMTSNIEQNSDNAQQTNKIATGTYKRMGRIEEASQKSIEAVRDITGKIDIIKDIAFQTNLLALNAAVEAARAGDQGKGFAVVAAEVRRLAERSRLAATEITDLSKASLQMTEESGNLLKEILPDINKTAKLVDEIAASSQEQFHGTAQINSAIQQLNTVTQQNAAASEELASSAEELSAQSEQLLDVISFFTTNETGNQVSDKKNRKQPVTKTNNQGKRPAENTRGYAYRMPGMKTGDRRNVA
jgi:methyl-accepting chemotaxis protein